MDKAKDARGRAVRKTGVLSYRRIQKRGLVKSFLGLILLIAFVWVTDAVIFNGRYSRAGWQGGEHYGSQVGTEVRRWLNKAGL